MAKKRNRTVTLAQFNGDHGTGTLAAKAGTRMEEVKNEDGKNPNKMARRRRISWLEQYRDRGILTDRQCAIGLDLQQAFEATQSSAPSIKKVQVDATMKPDQAIEIKLRRIGAYSKLARHVPGWARPIIDHVVLSNMPIERPNKGYLDCMDDHIKLLLALEKMDEVSSG